MSLDALIPLARAWRASDDVLPVVRLDDDAATGGLLAWFGAERDRRAARLVLRGEDVGVIERSALYELVGNRTLGWGDSIGSTLPGHPDWEPIELRCPIPDCPHSPAWVLSYDAASPPVCDVHPGEALRPAA